MKLFHIVSTAIITCLALLLGIMSAINFSNARIMQQSCPNDVIVNEHGSWHCMLHK